jgi:hypothetical protein
MPKSLLLIITIAAFGRVTGAVQGQDIISDSLASGIKSDTVSQVETHLWPALIRSAIVPGWGQIEQEHPGRAAVFYGLSVSMLYHLVWNYRQYEKTKVHSYRQGVSRYAILYAQVYTLNILDVLHNHIFHHDQPWPGQLFSDLPVKSPWGAVTRSAMLPGWGQLYNEKYIKSLISFGICMDFARKVYVFNQRYQRTGKKYYRERRVINSWYLGLCYMLNMVDAYVDAYLYKFDDMMKLTMTYSLSAKTPLLGVHFEF